MFTGRELDAETGLFYYRARYFSPDLGRFLSRDPLGFSAGDWNLYRYTFSNPITGLDPSGLEPPRALRHVQGPPHPNQRNEYFHEVADIVGVGGASPEALEAAKTIIEDAKTIEMLNMLRGLGGGAIKSGAKGALDAIAKNLVKKTLDPRKYAAPIGHPADKVNELFMPTNGYRLFVKVKYWSIECRFRWFWMPSQYHYVEHVKYVEIVPRQNARPVDWPYWGGALGRHPTAEELQKGIEDALK